MYIYKITNVINGKIYIGQCCKLPEKSKKYFGSGSQLKKAISKYGKEKFTKEILEQNIKNQKDLDTLEELYIKKFDACNREIGYNILPGTANGFGSGHPTSFPGVKEKISDKAKLRVGELNHMTGYKHTDEAKKIISETHKGKTMSEEARRLIGLASKGRKRPSMSETQREKLRQANLGKKASPETKAKMSKKSKR